MAEFVTQRDRRRALAADRPYIPLTPMGILPLLKAFLFDPFDPEWNCDSKRKIGVPVCVGCLRVFSGGCWGMGGGGCGVCVPLCRRHVHLHPQPASISSAPTP